MGGGLMKTIKIEKKISQDDLVKIMKRNSRQSMPLKSTKTIIDKKTKARQDRKAWRREL